MKKSYVMIGSSVLLVALLVLGTMAWFTSESGPVENTFTAGTVEIELIDEFDEEAAQNVNPGDKYDKVVTVKSNGSKATYVRVKLTEEWEGVEGETDTAGVASYIVNEDMWVLSDGWYYYKEILGPDDETQALITQVVFAGQEMGNNFQGASFELGVEAEGVQASNDAYQSVWGLTDLPTGVEAWGEVEPN